MPPRPNCAQRCPWLAAMLLTLPLAGCVRLGQERPVVSSAAAVTSAVLAEADRYPDPWMTHGRTYSEHRFSPLTEISNKNVADLGLAWIFETGTHRGLEATPVVVADVMYVSGSWSVVWALDAKSGKLLWEYDPEVAREYGQWACCDVVNRGVAVFAGRVYLGALDGRLIALDAATGREEWSALTVDQSLPYTITGPPRVIKGLVVIGNGGAEYGVRGYVSAYDAASGELVWRFFTVPGDPARGFENQAMEAAAETWSGEWWKFGGGGTVWDAMAYDPKLDLLYIGTGNGSPWNRQVRSPAGGDNLYLSSIIALRPETGEYVWHYQTTPGDSWDYTATQHIILADIEIAGLVRKVLMQAPKNGFFYVLDRTDGKLLSAEKFVPATWAERVDLLTGRPIETTNARYELGPVAVMPSPLGAHNWQPMAFSVQTGLVYIPVQEITKVFAHDQSFAFRPGQWNTGVARVVSDLVLPQPAGYLLAWDPVAQKERWRVDHGMPWAGGVLATAGDLIFQGTPGGMLTAFEAETGVELWRMYTGSGVIAPPISYAVEGRQYIAVLSGWGGAFGLSRGVPGGEISTGRLLAFALGAAGQAPTAAELVAGEVEALPDRSTPAESERGGELFEIHCAVCHGAAAVSNGVIADLRTAAPRVFEQYEAILIGGARQSRGMPSFSEILSSADAAAIRAFVLAQRNSAVAAGLVQTALPPGDHP